MKLTADQEKAVKSTGNVIVSAGAGSGKTAVLTRRVIYNILGENGSSKVNLDELLILTFTNEAASSMKNKIKKALSETDELKHQEELNENQNMIDSFISSKQVEGCSERTIKYYKEIIEKFVNNFDKSIKQISTNEIRNYLSNYKDNSSCGSTTIDNIRRVLSSFFSWLEDED